MPDIGTRIIMKDEPFVDKPVRLKRGVLMARETVNHADGPISTYLVAFDPPFDGHVGYYVDPAGHGCELTPDGNGWWVGEDDFLVLEPDHAPAS